MRPANGTVEPDMAGTGSSSSGFKKLKGVPGFGLVVLACAAWDRGWQVSRSSAGVTMRQPYMPSQQGHVLTVASCTFSVAYFFEGVLPV